MRKRSDGCGNTFGAGSYGLDFNNKGGGVYAVNLDKDAIKIFWWPRNKIPADVKANKPNPHKWGTPAALFKSSSSCNVSKYFKKMSIVSALPQIPSASTGSCLCVLC
jgi:hypothetical protein